MRASKTKIAMAAAVALSLGAGALVGVAASRAPLAATGERSYLTGELQLTPPQQEQMKEIWSQAMRASSEEFAERRTAAEKDRDAAVQALLSPEQWASYQKIREDYSTRLTEYRKERDAAFDSAVQRTKQMLTEPQRLKYEEMLKRRGHGRGRGRTGMPPGLDATSRPASEPRGGR